MVGGAAPLVIWWKPQALSVLRVNAALRVTSPEEGARHGHGTQVSGIRAGDRPQ